MSFTWRSAMSRGLLSGQRRGEDRKTDDRRSETHSMLNPPIIRLFGARLAVQGRYNVSLFHRVLSRSLQGVALRPLPCNYNVIQCVFHGGNTGSNPVGDAKSFQELTGNGHFRRRHTKAQLRRQFLARFA